MIWKKVHVIWSVSLPSHNIGIDVGGFPFPTAHPLGRNFVAPQPTLVSSQGQAVARHGSHIAKFFDLGFQ